jgi:hypothetical protein
VERAHSHAVYRASPVTFQTIAASVVDFLHHLPPAYHLNNIHVPRYAGV